MSPLPDTVIVADTANPRLSGTQTEPLQKVSAIRANQHATHFRVTIESIYAINYQKVSSADKKKCVFYLYNIKPDVNILSFGEKTAKNNSNIERMTFYQNDKTITVMEIYFRKDIFNTVTFRLPKGRLTTERLVFDIYHNQ